MTTRATERRNKTDAAEVARFFRRYGWSFERLDEDTFRTGFRGKNAAFVALVRVTPHWVVFTVNPLVRAPAHGFGGAMLRALASANQQANLAKLGLDEDGDAFINVELPAEGFAFTHFVAALGALSHFADTFVVPLLQAQTIDDLNTT
jgi:Putative bacterial sensory transduction regulator